MKVIMRPTSRKYSALAWRVLFFAAMIAIMMSHELVAQPLKSHGDGAKAKLNARLGDAYVRAAKHGHSWQIGTKSVEMSFSFRDGLFSLTGLTNRLTIKPYEYASGTSVLPTLDSTDSSDKWTLIDATVSQETMGGRPVLQLAVELEGASTRAQFYAIAYPTTSIIRQWLELENISADSIAVPTTVFSMGWREEPTASFTHYWMVGGNSKADQGMMHSAPIPQNYHQTLNSKSTSAFMPWMAFMRQDPSADGWFFELEYLSAWSMSVDSDETNQVQVTANIPGLNALRLAPGQKIQLPMITLGVFAGSLDDMAVRSYDWQYQYMWDYTNMDYYAKPKWGLPWVYCVQNVQEQFSERLAFLDMDADLCRAMGFDMLWDDAGWAMYPTVPEDSYGNVFTSGYESPDFAQTLRYLRKMDLRWLAWFVGRPSFGILDTKVGAWGDFEWRTDGVKFPDWASDRDLRARIEYFLDNHPDCSFHTCSGGSHYSHTFGVQRYANTNYFSDFGRGDQTNYYFSYVEPPDKWTDIIEPAMSKGVYRPETARQTLTMVPFWFFYAIGEDQEHIRKDVEIYHYLLREGVAGRYSYMFHPKITGDVEHYYSQRSSRDRAKVCIITKHRAPGAVIIYPCELLPDHKYTVGFYSSQETHVRSGADLMAHGIAIEKMAPGELIFLGLPDRPGSKRDITPPTAPANALIRQETNIGHAGIGIYWSPGCDNNWISYYEVKRNNEILGKAGVGTYYFDHSKGWSAKSEYSLRTVDGAGNASSWIEAKAIAGEPITACALGGLFSEQGRDGWYAETAVNGKTFLPMIFVKPAATSAADLGGSPNKPGGVEGYWEGPGGAHIGRAWMQASTLATCARTWVAPATGSVQVVSRVMKEYYRQGKGSSLHVRIMRNADQLWPECGWAKVPANSLVGLIHDLFVKVTVGDTIRFILDKGTDPANDIIAWMPRIVYIDGIKPASSGSIVRILCGAKKAYVDHTGNLWSQDRCFTGGKAVVAKSAVKGATPTDDDQTLYQFGRKGKCFAYSIPVQPGLYSVRLKFAEPIFKWIYQRPFNVSVNGVIKLRNFDICQNARGCQKARDRIFHNIVPDAEGKITLRFTAGYDPVQQSHCAIVQAIEILPEIKPSIRIDCGSDRDFVDWNSCIWSQDQPNDSTQALNSTTAVAQASPTPLDQALYQTARSGKNLVYQLKTPPGHYAVHLKFAELWLPEIGKRPMDIEINGQEMWKSWDPAAAAGQLAMAADIRAKNVTPDNQGVITIRIKAVGANDAILQGIELE